MLNNERRLCERDEPLLNPLFDMTVLLSPGIRLAPGTWAFPCESFSPSLFYCTFPLFYFDVRQNWLPSRHPAVPNIILNLPAQTVIRRSLFGAAVGLSSSHQRTTSD
jgi:hypothetical protein